LDEPPTGPLTLPGSYTVTLAKEVEGQVTELTSPVSFRVIPLDLATFSAHDKAAVLAFQQKVARLQRAVEGACGLRAKLRTGSPTCARPFVRPPRRTVARGGSARPGQPIGGRARPTPRRFHARQTRRTIATLNPGAGQPCHNSQWRATSPPTGTEQDAYRYAGGLFEKALAELRSLVERDLANLEKQLEAAGARGPRVAFQTGNGRSDRARQPKAFP